MKHNIGSKQAEKLARDHFGPDAYVARMGRRFIVCTEMKRVFGYTVGNIRGRGKSWESALKDAGISIPVNEPYFPAKPAGVEVPVYDDVQGVGV